MSTSPRSSGAPGRDGQGHADQPRRALGVAALATVLALVGFTGPVTVLNALVADLGSDVAGRTWILSSMGIGLGAALLTAGTLADHLGHRTVLVGGLVVLAVASVLGALAPTTVVLVLARVLQGVGSAAVVATSLGLIARWHPVGPARARASGVWGASVGAGIALGPVLSAYLQAWASWRDVFWLLALTGLGLAVWARLRLEEVRASAPRGLDPIGAVLLATASTALLAALVIGRQGWTRPAVGVLAGVVVLSGAGLVAAERRGRAPMVEPAVFRSPRFLGATAGAFTSGVGLIGLMSFLPAFLGLALGMRVTDASQLFLVWAAFSVAAALLARRLPARFDGRLRLAAGLGGVGVGLLMLGGLGTDTTWPRLLPGLVVSGAAGGLVNAVLGREAVESVPPDRGGMGSGANNTARYIGSAVGVTIVSVLVAGHATRPPGPGLVDGWNVAALVSAAFSFVGAGIVLVVRDRTAGAAGAPSTAASPASNRPGSATT